MFACCSTSVRLAELERRKKDGTVKHGTMRKSSVEALVGRKFKTKLANLRTKPGRGRRDNEEARD